MKAYDYLAPYYDTFMGFMEYDDEAKRLHGFLNEINAKNVLDIGVGSGGHLIPLLRNGHHIDALDISEPMLKVLEGKLLYQGLNTRLSQGDMCSFRTKRPYDAIYAFGDTIHHLSEKSDLETFLKTSYENLKEGGYLCFTWRNRKYFEELTEVGTFYEDHGNDYLLWDITYDENESASMKYTAFIAQGDENYHRIQEKHLLLAYDPKDIKTASKNAGFHLKTDMAKEWLITVDDADEFKETTVLQKPIQNP